MSRVSIIGAYNTTFGVFTEKNRETGELNDLKSFYHLLIEAGRGAIADSGLAPKDIDAVYIGSCSPSLFVNQEHVAPAAVAIDDALRLKPMTRTEGACASSTLALYEGVYAIEAGRYRNVLVIGVEKMTLLDMKGVTHALSCCSYYPEEGSRGMTFPGLFAEMAKAYRAHYAIPEAEFRRMLATVSALGYLNGAENPLAHFGPDGGPARQRLFTADAILNLPDEGKGANVMIAPPLRLHDCSLVSDGAAALVLTGTENARKMKKRFAEVAGIGHTEDHLPLSRREKKHTLEAAKHAKEKAFKEAGITLDDVDLAEVHDCFTINQLLCTEALGLSKDGKAGYDFLAGRFTRDDRCPVNLSGGLKSKGHPVGATGASMHAMAYKQLIGEPVGAKPRNAPEVGVILNVGGSSVTNCVTVLRRG
ncbi:MAG: propanoyl-CoA acyltransferase [Planctomycetota bacterium]